MLAPSHGANGLNSCRRCESGLTTTSTPEPSAAGASNRYLLHQNQPMAIRDLLALPISPLRHLRWSMYL